MSSRSGLLEPAGARAAGGAVPRYTAVARALHWLCALGIVTAVAVALSFDGMALSPRKIHLINYHKWAGLTVLWLLIARSAWRVTHAPPPLPPALPRWEGRLAHATHAALYVLMAATPLLGWWLSSSKGFAVRYLGLFALPDLAPKSAAAAQALQPIHAVLAWFLLGLAGLHALAALKHHFLDGDEILRRMT